MEIQPRLALSKATAIISRDRQYRYELTRHWNAKLNPLFWIMLNPSTADARTDDPTIRRCISLAKSWGYGSIRVYNLFALRSPHPRHIMTVDDPVGPENDRWLRSAARSRHQIIAAWGACRMPLVMQRAARVTRLLQHERKCHPMCLGKTKTGDPKHPLYIRTDVVLETLLKT